MSNAKSNLEITFDKAESDQRTNNGWNWFYFTIISNEKTFDGSLVEMCTKVGGQDTTATEITWVNETPDNRIEIEKLILMKFQETF